MKNIEKEMLKFINIAIKHDEVPVCAFIVRNNKIIAKAYNKTNKTNNPLSHAEILVVQKTCKKLKNWRLNDCVMYVNLKPCKMCEEVLKSTRIKEVYYYLDNNNSNDNTIKYVKKETEYNKIFETKIKSFFLKKR